jgi:hypothetical protein
MTYHSEVTRQALKRGLIATLIENDEPTLSITCLVKSAEEAIKSITNLLERVFHWVVGRPGRLVHNGGKKAYLVRLSDSLEHLKVGGVPLILSDASPVSLPTADISTTEFQ